MLHSNAFKTKGYSNISGIRFSPNYFVLPTHLGHVVVVHVHEQVQTKQQLLHTTSKITFNISVGKSLPSLIPLFMDIK